MTRGTKEFYEIMEAFERTAPSFIYGHKIERYPRDVEIKGQFYKDSHVNTLFIAFMHGYQLMKCNANLEQN